MLHDLFYGSYISNTYYLDNMYALNFDISFWFSTSQPANFSDIRCDILNIRGDNYKVWKERILIHLGWMDIDYDIRKEEPFAIIEESNIVVVALYEQWERSNQTSMMLIKIKVITSIHGFVDQHKNVC